MGNSYTQEQRKGYRILKLEPNSPASESNLQVLTDYVMQPEPHNISLNQRNVQLQVYSLVDQTIRSVNLSLNGKSIGLQVRSQVVQGCMLKVVGMIKGSPMQKHDVQTEEDFVVGMVEHPYYSLKEFVGCVRQQLEKENQCITLGVYSTRRGFRLVRIEVKELLAWRTKGKGILGCQLAQGWLNRLRPSRQPLPSKPHTTEKTELPSPKETKQCEFQQKMIEHFGEPQTQKHFKGILRKDQVQDWSQVCRCSPTNKTCQLCFKRVEYGYSFYCKKINGTYTIPDRALFQY